MTLKAKLLCMMLLMVFLIIYILENIVVGRQWDVTVWLSLSLYIVLFLVLVHSYRKQKKQIKKERLLNELLSNDEL